MDDSEIGRQSEKLQTPILQSSQLLMSEFQNAYHKSRDSTLLAGRNPTAPY